jgi:hypothetical protein
MHFITPFLAMIFTCSSDAAGASDPGLFPQEVIQRGGIDGAASWDDAYSTPFRVAALMETCSISSFGF